MKNLFTLTLVLLACAVQAQTTTSYSIGKSVDYEIKHDIIDKPWAIVNFDFVQLDMNTSNLGGSSFNLALRGYVDPIEMAGVDYTFRKSLLTGLFKGSNTDFELGGHYYLIKSERKNVDTKVILRQSWDKDYNTGRDITEVVTRSIQIPAKRLVYRGVRGGLITKKGPYEIEDIEGVVDADVTLSSTGFYAGVMQKAFTNVFINTKQYGEAYESVGRDLMIDVLFYPTNNFDISNVEGGPLTEDQIKDDAGAGNLGFRVVYDIYQIEKKEYTGKMFGFTKRFEAGYKPFQGFYVAVGFGWTILKSKYSPL